MTKYLKIALMTISFFSIFSITTTDWMDSLGLTGGCMTILLCLMDHFKPTTTIYTFEGANVTFKDMGDEHD